MLIPAYPTKKGQAFYFLIFLFFGRGCQGGDILWSIDGTGVVFAATVKLHQILSNLDPY